MNIVLAVVLAMALAGPGDTEQTPRFCTLWKQPNKILCQVVYLAYIWGFTDHGGPVIGPPPVEAGELVRVVGIDTYTQCILCDAVITFPISKEQCPDPSRISMYYDDGFFTGYLDKSLTEWEFDRNGLTVGVRWTIKDLSSWANPENYTAEFYCEGGRQ